MSYKVNEKALVVANKSYHGFEIGNVVKIVEVHGAVDGKYYTAESKGRYWSLTEAELAPEPELQIGTTVRVLNDDKWMHDFEIGSEVVCHSLYHQHSDGGGHFTSPCGSYNQVLHPSEYEIVHVAAPKEAAVEGEVKDPKTKKVYALLDSEGEVIEFFRTRKAARKEKAYQGGAAHGVVIQQYSATKIVR